MRRMDAHALTEVTHKHQGLSSRQIRGSQAGFSLAWKEKKTVFCGIKQPSQGTADLNQSSENRISCRGQAI